MQSNNQKIQQKDLAGKTKLTLVRIGQGSHVIQFFANLFHDANGNAILPEKTLNEYLDALNVKRGQTWWHG
jgi:hypothetical protein